MMMVMSFIINQVRAELPESVENFALDSILDSAGIVSCTYTEQM